MEDIMNRLVELAEGREDHDIWPNDIKKLVKLYDGVMGSAEKLKEKIKNDLQNYGFVQEGMRYVFIH